MSTERPRITITFEPDIYQQIVSLSAKEGRSLSSTVRRLTEQSLNIQLVNENLDFITSIMRTQLRDIMRLYVDKITSLESKTCIQAGAAAYLCAETLNSFVPESRRIEFSVAYDKARKKAVEYVKKHPDLLE